MPMSSKLLFNLISLNYTSNVRFQLPSIIKSHKPNFTPEVALFTW